MSSNPLKECKRCQRVTRQSNFNSAFDCCKCCVTDEDRDHLQPEITQIMRGFSAKEKSEIMREAFIANKKRKEDMQYGQKDQKSA